MKKYIPSLWRIGIAVIASIFLAILTLYSYEGLFLEKEPSHVSFRIWGLSEIPTNNTARPDDNETPFISSEKELNYNSLDAMQIPRKILSALAIGNPPKVTCIPCWLANDLVSNGVIEGTGVTSSNPEYSQFAVDGKLASFPYAEMALFISVTGAYIPDELGVSNGTIELKKLFETIKETRKKGYSFRHNLATNPYLLSLILSNVDDKNEVSKILEVLSSSSEFDPKSIIVEFGFSSCSMTTIQNQVAVAVNGRAITEQFGIAVFGELGVFDISSYVKHQFQTAQWSKIARFGIFPLSIPVEKEYSGKPRNSMNSEYFLQTSIKCSWLKRCNVLPDVEPLGGKR